MHKRCLILGNYKIKFLEQFLSQKNFIFLEFDKVNILNFPDLIIINNHPEEKELDKKIRHLESFNLESIFMMPISIKSKFIFKNPRHRKIFYPIHIGDLEKLLKNKTTNINNSFKDVLIKYDNLIVNKHSGLEVHLTDTEVSLVINLIQNGKAKKEDIRQNILNFNHLSNTRSLESHLSRIRKKLSKINSKITINSEEGEFIKIN